MKKFFLYLGWRTIVLAILIGLVLAFLGVLFRIEPIGIGQIPTNQTFVASSLRIAGAVLLGGGFLLALIKSSFGYFESQGKRW